ncbi:cell division protein FtsN [Idiomarina sp. WRN-38]|jgi:cell division protein FtsN|uniref:SPOR domain-containing protein n=1 Tax=Idiomarina sp. OXR-189 TaxID=3100175 RepID=UPI0007334D36|nr:SPOR domain-containing protein [Idiomarina sp. OXR-189]KTG24608.1 cell division protein FtsN [Idiomarina sp. H105]OAE93114.1 cell division protein FtsN [Idiomarina sp. WRN-38]WPZ01215.1 SPOR domain-containing protein [Idiomarina sp. OXR-189]|tara:strand:+ start:710 stop:1279 length:570 start_codon:yes stop_codon:yes gene_type:complete
MDYANRKPKQNKRKPSKKKGSNKKTQRGAKPVSDRQPVPWAIVIIAVAIIAGFVYFLVSISGKSEEQANQPEVQAPPADLLPEKSAERWRYIEELESKEVEVDVPEREVGPQKLMQCGSFRQQSDAERLRAQIAMAGLESQVRATEGSNGLWYRVILGPYETKRDAERDRHKLQRNQVFGCAIWNWNID